MLRKLILKNREIPIPVPVRTLGDVINWVEDTLLCKDAILTSAVLEDRELINELYRKSIKDIPLGEMSRLQINIDTPKDLSSQSLDVVCDLAYGIASRIRKISFNSWHGIGARSKGDLEELHSDLELLLELVQHINDLLDEGHAQYASINMLGHNIGSENTKFSTMLASENWQELASVLGDSLEPLLKNLAYEGEKVQIKLLTAHIA